MNEWKTLVENASNIKQIIDKHYRKHESLIKYLDNENLLKVDLRVKAPLQNISEDVQNFDEKFEQINAIMEHLEKLYQEKELLPILEKIPLLIELQKLYEKLKYILHL